MKLSSVNKPVIDLDDNPTMIVISKLKKYDIVSHAGQTWIVTLPPKKTQRNVWWLGLANNGIQKYIRLVPQEKPAMTEHEKSSMLSNIRGVVEMYRDNPRLVEIAKNYYYNLSTHNRYRDSDVRECMSLFPVEVLQKAGIPL